MKKIGIAVLVIIICIGIYVYSSNKNNNKILGKWQEVNTPYTLQTEFFDNGLAVSTMNGKKTYLKWSLKDENILNVVFTENNNIQQYTIKLDGDTLTLSDGKYPPALLKRVK